MMSYDYGGRDERQNSTCILSGMDIALGERITCIGRR
jgi:hypothetical protein